MLTRAYQCRILMGYAVNTAILTPRSATGEFFVIPAEADLPEGVNFPVLLNIRIQHLQDNIQVALSLFLILLMDHVFNQMAFNHFPH